MTGLQSPEAAPSSPPEEGAQEASAAADSTAVEAAAIRERRGMVSFQFAAAPHPGPGSARDRGRLSRAAPVGSAVVRGALRAEGNPALARGLGLPNQS
ncbi:hypothetical protein GCM10027440_16940 [Nocardiopsis coralliicola]